MSRAEKQRKRKERKELRRRARAAERFHRGKPIQLHPENAGMDDAEFEEFMREGRRRADLVASAMRPMQGRCDYCSKMLDVADEGTAYSLRTVHRDGPPPSQPKRSGETSKTIRPGGCRSWTPRGWQGSRSRRCALSVSRKGAHREPRPAPVAGRRGGPFAAPSVIRACAPKGRRLEF
jgi:hypothetical protein